MRTREKVGSAVTMLLATIGGACSSPTFPRDLGHGVCPQGGEQRSVLLVDKGSEVRGKIEALRSQHAVAVRQDGCNVEVLAACRVNAHYRYAAITPKHDRVRLRDEVELYANVPLSAASLSAKLRSAGELDVDMTVVGRYDVDREGIKPGDLSGDCAAVTHVVTGITTGAMRFVSGASGEVRGGAAIAGASASSSGEVLSQDGDERACAAAKGGEAAPPFGCGAALRLDLVPIGVSAQPHPICAGGTRWNGVQCETLSPTAGCPAGEMMVQGACVGPGSCAAGFRFEPGKGCVPAPAQPAAAAGGMVRIPGATFMMGWPGISGPQHRVTVAAFEIDVTEVTAGAYRACVEAGGCAEPRHGGSCNFGKAEFEKHPMNCVDWAEAKAYCAWAGKRLPTEAEWEFAAVGQTGWEHPWGNTAPEKDQYCQLRSDRPAWTCPVGSFPRGASKFGVLDQHGNVSEWVADTFCSYDRPQPRYPGDPDAQCKSQQKVTRSWARHRGSEGPTQSQPSLGFRCARTP